MTRINVELLRRELSSTLEERAGRSRGEENEVTAGQMGVAGSGKRGLQENGRSQEAWEK